MRFLSRLPTSLASESYIDALFAWMAENPWSVGLMVCAAILLAGYLETPL